MGASNGIRPAKAWAPKPAMGGALDIVARFADGSVNIRNFADLGQTKAA